MTRLLQNYLSFLNEQAPEFFPVIAKEVLPKVQATVPPTVNSVKKILKANSIANNVFLDKPISNSVKKQIKKIKDKPKKDKVNKNKKNIHHESKDYSQIEKIQQIKNYYKQKKEELKLKQDEFKEKIKDQLISLRDSSRDDIIEELEKKKQKTFRYFANKRMMLTNREIAALKKTIKGGKIISGFALATFIITKSISIYQEKQDQYEQFCLNKSGKSKQMCIAKVRLKMLQDRSNFLKVATTNCNKSKDPIECKDRIDKEIIKLENSIQKYFKEFGHDMIS